MDDLSTRRLETDRLILRPWNTTDAAVWHELWTERDPRVPPHRRISAEGRPTADDIAEWIRTGSYSRGLLALERKGFGDVIGYCGLIDYKDGEHELAFELLQKTWRQGYATEASAEIVRWARTAGYQRLWATVWDWNIASRRVLTKLGFVETETESTGESDGNSLLTTKEL